MSKQCVVRAGNDVILLLCCVMLNFSLAILLSIGHIEVIDSKENAMYPIASFEKTEIHQEENGSYLVFSRNKICLLHTNSIVDAYKFAEKFGKAK